MMRYNLRLSISKHNFRLSITTLGYPFQTIERKTLLTFSHKMDTAGKSAAAELGWCSSPKGNACRWLQPSTFNLQTFNLQPFLHIFILAEPLPPWLLPLVDRVACVEVRTEDNDKSQQQ